MLSFIIHSLLLLPVRSVHPLLHDLLSLLPYLDRLNALLPAAKLLETEELSWSVADGTYLTVLMYCQTYRRAVFFNFFAAAEPYKSVKITHGTPWHAMICESNGVGKVEFSGCLGTDVPSGVKRQKTCGSLGQNPETLMIKQQAKDLFNFTVFTRESSYAFSAS